MNRVMLDLETLGLDAGCAIISLGAVKFDETGTGETFYRSISLVSCDDAGLGIDAGTLEWWLGQDDNARDQLTGGEELTEVLHEFGKFYDGADEIWANAPSFDCDVEIAEETNEYRCPVCQTKCVGERERDKHAKTEPGVKPSSFVRV